MCNIIYSIHIFLIIGCNKLCLIGTFLEDRYNLMLMVMKYDPFGFAFIISVTTTYHQKNVV